MITENYVSFEIAKLLKEKGFDEPTTKSYYTEGFENPMIFSHDLLPCIQTDEFLCPTHQMAMKWLREVYNILIVVDYEWECDTTPYYFKIYRLGENGKPEQVPVKGVSYDKDDIPTEHIVGYRDWERSNDDFKSYEQACEMAIKYCLENLI